MALGERRFLFRNFVLFRTKAGLHVERAVHYHQFDRVRNKRLQKFQLLLRRPTVSADQLPKHWLKNRDQVGDKSLCPNRLEAHVTTLPCSSKFTHSIYEELENEVSIKVP